MWTDITGRRWLGAAQCVAFVDALLWTCLLLGGRRELKTRARTAGGGDGRTQEAPTTGNRVPGQSLHCFPHDTGRGIWPQSPIPKKEGPCDFGRWGTGRQDQACFPLGQSNYQVP